MDRRDILAALSAAAISALSDLIICDARMAITEHGCDERA